MTNPGRTFVPMQLAAVNDLYKKQESEVVHWVVYEPPYRNRWRDDSVIDEEEKKQDDGYNLHSIRKKEADKIVARGANSYLDRIQKVAIQHQIIYKGISKPEEFWTYLLAMDDASISRVRYCGHATKTGLMLALFHDSACSPILGNNEMLLGGQLEKLNSLSQVKKKFSKKPGLSEFYGCNTELFAKQWKAAFGVPAAGTQSTINFAVVNQPSSIQNVLERIQKTADTGGVPGWVVHR